MHVTTGDVTTGDGSRDFVLDFKWLAGLLITLLFSVGGYAISRAMADIETLKARQSIAEMHANDTKNEIGNVRSNQERDHRLIVQIARKMGIEVAE